MPLSETASRPEHRIRDVVSACGLVRKACPTLSTHSGVQFPPETPPGKCIPVWSRNLGCSFRLKGDPESASHSEWQFRVTVSADTRRQSAAHITCLQICDPETQKQQIECSFSKSTRPETYPVFITCHRSRSPITAHRFGCKKVAENRPSTCMVRFWSAFGQLSGKLRLIRFCYPKGGGSS